MSVYLKLDYDMAKSLFLPFFLSLLSFFSFNPSISKTVRYTGLKFCTQVGFDDQMCKIFVNNNKATPVIHYKWEILLHITGYP